jgi:hypothetical protein
VWCVGGEGALQGSNTDNASCLCDAFGCAELMSLNDEFIAIVTTPTSEQISKKVKRCLRPYYHASQLRDATCRQNLLDYTLTHANAAQHAVSACECACAICHYEAMTLPHRDSS